MNMTVARSKRWRRLKREQEIVRVLFRHGLGWLVTSLGLGAAVPFHRGLLGHPKREERYSAGEHLRMAFEDLGSTFIKLAQILSTRPDLVSPEYAREFSKLQEDVPSLPFEEMETVLKEELGEDYHSRFKHFETAPLGSASIAQVYRAKLRNGRSVVVKVQRPDAAEVIALDLEILDRFARRLTRKTDWGRHYDLPGFCVGIRVYADERAELRA